MFDKADSALMTAFKSTWKRENILQTKIIKLNKKLLTRGRRRKPRGRYMNYHGRIVADYSVVPAIDVNGAMTQGIQPQFSVEKNHRRFGMNPRRFCELLHKITDPERGDEFFQTCVMR